MSRLGTKRGSGGTVGGANTASGANAAADGSVSVSALTVGALARALPVGSLDELAGVGSGCLEQRSRASRGGTIPHNVVGLDFLGAPDAADAPRSRKASVRRARRRGGFGTKLLPSAMTA